MAIDVEIQDERGRALARYDGPALGLDFVDLAPPSSACFRFVMPYANTTFNEEQIKVLKKEVKEAAARTTHAQRLHELRSLSEFLEGAHEPHVYVKFIGD